MADLIPFKIESALGEELFYVDANAGILYLGGRTHGIKVLPGGVVSIIGNASLPGGNATIPQSLLDEIALKVNQRTGYSLVPDSEILKIHELGSDNQDYNQKKRGKD
jgi:hypothetical protein